MRKLLCWSECLRDFFLNFKKIYNNFIMSEETAIFLFAPKFKEFGVDMVRALVKNNPSLTIIALCTGGKRTVDYIRAHIPENNFKKIFDLEAIENSWFECAPKMDTEYISSLDKKYTLGAFGDVVVADRRVGYGYVSGGKIRPDLLAEKIQKDLTNPSYYVQELFKFLEDLFIQNKITFVFLYAVAGAPAVALGHVCSKFSVFFLRFTHTRVGNNYIIDKDFKGRLSSVNARYNNIDASFQEGIIERAKDFVFDFRETNNKPEYYLFNSKKRESATLSKFLSKFFLHLVAYCFRGLLPEKIRDRVSFIGVRRALFDLECAFRKNLYKGKFPLTIDNVGNYYYFPLHVDPEASTMVLSPRHTDQISIIESISKCLPANAVLVVKEHLPMIGKRPSSFYKRIDRMPRVTLVSPSLDSKTVILKSQGVVVITGTAAFEAALLGKKTIVLGDSPYLSLKKSILHHPCLNSIDEAFIKLDSLKEKKDDELIRFLCCIYQESFEMNSSFLWGNYLSHEASERESVCDVVAERIINVLNNEKS